LWLFNHKFKRCLDHCKYFKWHVHGGCGIGILRYWRIQSCKTYY
jgi:hypothetical protein